MKKNTMSAILIVVSLFANFALAEDDVSVKTNVTANPTATATATGGSATATGGKATVKGSGNSNNSGNATINDLRQFAYPIGGYQTYPTTPPNSDRHHRTAQAVFTEYTYLNQARFDSMVNFLIKAHDMDSNTRTWEDMRDDLVVQPRFESPATTALRDQDPVVIVGSNAECLRNINMDQSFVGFITVRDSKPRENSVDNMYFVYAAYPYAKMAGVNMLVKVDAFFLEMAKSGAWGAGIGGVIASFFSSVTGGTGAVNGGYNSANAMAYVSGGEMYMALHVKLPCPQTPPAEEVRNVPKACNPSIFIEEYTKAEARIALCRRYCHANMLDRLIAAKNRYAAFICNGRKSKDLPQLDIVIEHLYMAELNYIHGYDIREHADSAAIIKDVEYYLSSAIYERFGSDVNFWVEPERVKHENKKTGSDKWVKLTKSEWVQIYAIRRTLEKRSEHLEVIF